MTATSTCPTLLQGTRMRATLVDSCGAPMAGACSTIVTDGFISVTIADQIEAPDEFKGKTAGGTFYIHQRSTPLLNWSEVTVDLCQVMPELLHMLTGLPLIYDDSTPTPKAVGFGKDTSSYASASFALELWTNIAKTKGQSACASGVRYGYLLLPWLIEGTISDVKIENGPCNFSIKTITSDANDWGVGPYNVINTRLGVPHPLLAAIPTDRAQHLQFTTLAPPAPYCGCQDLVLPS